MTVITKNAASQSDRDWYLTGQDRAEKAFPRRVFPKYMAVFQSNRDIHEQTCQIKLGFKLFPFWEDSTAVFACELDFFSGTITLTSLIRYALI